MNRTTLLPPINGVCLLVVEESLVDISLTIEFLRHALSLARSIYPSTRSLLPVHGPEYDYITDTTLELHDIKTYQGN
jgi:hypothetical protein